MRSIIPFRLILLVALAPAFPARAQTLPQRSTPPAQPAAPSLQNEGDFAFEGPNGGALHRAREIAPTLALVAMGWLLIVLLMGWASGQKPGRADGVLIAAGVLIWLALRCATYYLTSHSFLLLENPRLFSWWLSLRALNGAYNVALAILFLSTLGYGLRRAVTKRQISRSGIVWWGLFYSALFLGFMGMSRAVPGHTVFLALALGYVVVWLCCNPWLIVGQLAEYYKSQGKLQKALSLQQKALARPHLSPKTRFALLNDCASNYQSLGDWHRALEFAGQALALAPAYQSAEVLLRANLVECYLFLERLPEAVEQSAEIFRLTETVSCVGGAGAWQGVGHGLLAAINLRRGWFDEAAHQAALCLETFPPEAETGALQRNMVALAKSVQAALLLAEHKPKAAARLCRQALKRKPRYSSAAHVRTLYASVLLAGDKWDEAAEQCRLALEACEKWPAAHFWLGHIQRAQDKEEEAQRSFEAAIAVYPAHPYAARARQVLGMPAVPEPPLPEIAAPEFPEREQVPEVAPSGALAA